MTTIQMIAIDIDGTLLNSQRQLTETVKQTLQAASKKGIKIVLCTGRPLKGVQKLLEELDLVGNEEYVITYNGSLVQTTDGSRVIAEYSLTLNDVKYVKQIADALDTYYHVIDREAIYTTNQNIGKYSVHEATLVDMPLRYRTLEQLENMQLVAQKAMIVDEPTVLDSVIAQLPEQMKQQYGVVKSAPFYLEILNKQANKGTAVTALANHLNIDLAHVMAIGDNDNDIDMLEVVGHSVAMGNAVERVKNIARHHTKTNNEDGVAWIVSQYL